MYHVICGTGENGHCSLGTSVCRKGGIICDVMFQKLLDVIQLVENVEKKVLNNY